MPRSRFAGYKFCQLIRWVSFVSGLTRTMIFSYFWVQILLMKGKFILVISLCLTMLACAKRQQPAGPPNIIFILSDDHAKRALSIYDTALINTPHLDRIGREGMRFDRAFVTNSICAPSRAVFLTGKYSHINGLRDNRDEFDGSQPTFPKYLQQAGYQTALIGKWHLKTAPTGFDYWNILIDQGHYYNPDFIENGDTSRREGYVSDLITDYALRYLNQRQPDKPFLLLYWHKTPHRNWMPDIQDLPEFTRTYPEPATLFDKYTTRTSAAHAQDLSIRNMFMSSDMKLLPDYYENEEGSGGAGPDYDAKKDWEAIRARMTPQQRAAWDAHYQKINEEYRRNPPQGDDLTRWKYQRYLQDYLGTVRSLDRNVGRLLEYLDDQNLTENTLVIYGSDQGFFLGEHGWYDKRFMYEETLGTPLLMRWPGTIEPGAVNSDLVLNLDVAPTLLEVAGIPDPGDMQGRSLIPVLRGETPADWRTSFYYHYYEFPHGWHSVKKHEGVRTATQKLIRFYGEREEYELYDLDQDAQEMQNLSGTEAYRHAENNLKQLLQEHREKLMVKDDQ